MYRQPYCYAGVSASIFYFFFVWSECKKYIWSKNQKPEFILKQRKAWTELNLFGSYENSGDRPTFPTAVKKPQLFGGEKKTYFNIPRKTAYLGFFSPTSSQNDVLLDFPHVWRVEINTNLAGSKPDS